MKPHSSILVTGSTGMVGRALLCLLKSTIKETHYQLLAPPHAELDLRDQQAVSAYFAKHKPDYVFHLAAIVGGIYANSTFPAKFIYDNTQMHCNVIHAAHQSGVKKILFPGSACTYPKLAPQPIKESSLLDGKFDPSVFAYASSKINGIIMCQSYAREHQLPAIVPMPTNSYGVGDNFDPLASHVIPALMKRFHEAAIAQLNEVVLWGSGTPLREFIYVDDLADALLFLMEHYDSSDIINVGSNEEISIIDLAREIAAVVGFQGTISLDTSKPDGPPRKCLDSSALFALGWKPRVSLREGLRKMYEYHFNINGNSELARA